MIFDLAWRAQIPVIGVQTDDLVNFERVLNHLTGRKVVRVEKKMPASTGPYTYWTDDASWVTPEVYEKLKENEWQLVVVNSAEPNDLVFDAGTMPTPEKLVRRLLFDLLQNEEHAADVYPAVRGMSLKAVWEIMQLTQARAGSAWPHEVRRTRASYLGVSQGLYLEDTTYDFYVWPKALKEWLDLNRPYFLRDDVHAKLVPRALLLYGTPGVGKSMASKAFANELKVPLYRLDLAGSLSKYVGESEARLTRLLGLVDREAPCVLLLDEIEKVLTMREEGGPVPRLLSMLLWWLQEHQSRVFTVMTTNARWDQNEQRLEGLPTELYRKGRVDKVFCMPKLPQGQAVYSFASQCFESVVKKKSDEKQTKRLWEALQPVASDGIAHADVAEVVYTEVKKNHWA